MPDYVYWFLLALMLLGLEMTSGTFYLLVLAVAMAVGGVVALLGIGVSVQFASSAAAGVVGTILLRRWKGGRAAATGDQNLDAGHPVRVVRWNDDGTARVHYRGAEWDAEVESPGTQHATTMYIKTTRGSVLILTDRKPI